MSTYHQRLDEILRKHDENRDKFATDADNRRYTKAAIHHLVKEEVIGELENEEIMGDDIVEATFKRKDTL